MVLGGLEPEVILDVCSKAIGIYLNQVKFEVHHMDKKVAKSMSKIETVKKYYENVKESLCDIHL